MTTTSLDKALALAATGFAVFPLSPGSKRPLPGSDGFKSATRDVGDIGDMFGGEYVPVGAEGITEYNIGIYPWACEPRLMVVDLDEGGQDTLDRLEMQYGLLPDTLTVETPSGGRHVYFTVPDDAPTVPSSTRRVGTGVDIRAEGGYVVAPGSTVDGRTYRVVWPNGGETLFGAKLRDAPSDDGRSGVRRGVSAEGPRSIQIARAPAWLLDLAGRSPERHADADKLAPGIDAWDLPANVERAKEWLKREAAAGRVAVAGRGSNAFTYQTAACVRDFGITEETCGRLLEDSGWNAACTPARRYEEPLGIINHVYTYAKRPAGLSRNASPEALEQMSQAAQKAAREVAPPEAASRFRLLRWPDIMSMAPPVWMVADTLTERGVLEIYGPYSSYKSFLALDLALSLATGVEWAGRGIGEKRRAVYVAGEGAAGIRQRAAAWAGAHSLSEVPDFGLSPAMPIFGDADDLRAFGESVSGFSPSLIVFDTAAHAMAGLDENASKDVGTFMARVYELRDALGCSIVLVHHSGKDVGKGSRGSTAIPAACDTILRVEAVRPLEALVTMEKQKDAEIWRDPQGFRAQITAGSLVFRPEKLAPSRNDDAEQLRVEALIGILERLGAGVSIETAPLAYEIACIVNPTLDEPGRQKLSGAIRQWLNRVARERTDIQKFLAHKAVSRGEVNQWAFPKEGEADVQIS